MSKSRFANIFAILGFIGSNWQWLATFVASLVVTAVAVFTGFLKPYAPFSYAVAFLFGAVLFMAVLSLGALDVPPPLSSTAI